MSGVCERIGGRRRKKKAVSYGLEQRDGGAGSWGAGIAGLSDNLV